MSLENLIWADILLTSIIAPRMWGFRGLIPPGHEHPVVQTGVLSCCLSVQVRQLFLQAPLQRVMQPDVDGQGLSGFPSLFGVGKL